MDRATLVKDLEAALEHLYDRAYLGDSALARWLAGDGGSLRPDRLHRRLVDAIDELRPPPGSPPTTASWRRHRYLDLRYLEGESHKATATRLALSLRQAHRVRVDALNVVADRLLRTGSERVDVADDRPRLARAGRFAPAVAPTPLDDELTRLEAEASDVSADVLDALRGVVEVVRPLAAQRGATIRVEAEEGPRLAAVGRAVLRQVLVLILTGILGEQNGGSVVLAIQGSGNQLVVDVLFAAPDAAAERLLRADPRLVAAARLIAPRGGALDLVGVASAAEPAVEGARDRAALTGLRLSLPPPKRETVLAIDDNPDLARLFEVYLQGTRYNVIRAKTGASALRLAEKHRPDVITLDVMMPFQDGWEIFRQLRANPRTREIPIVVCSVLPEKDLAVALGATDFLAKPVTRDRLIATLDHCLGSGSAAS
jgi:CheY-like chemotaxis protein